MGRKRQISASRAVSFVRKDFLNAKMGLPGLEPGTKGL
jgi:hypothetical protein